MKVTKLRVELAVLILLFFMYYAGYYLILILVANTVGNEASRTFTIPLRISFLLLIVSLFLLEPRFRLNKAVLFFLLFSLAYFVRIVIEMYDDTTIYSMPTYEFLLYFIAFVFLPFVFMSQVRIERQHYHYLGLIIVFSCALIAVPTLFFYGDLINQVARFNVSTQENYISPLALSYVSALGISIGSILLATRPVRGLERWAVVGSVLACLVPFFLGASRGSVVALAVVWVFYISASKNAKYSIRGVLSVVFLTAIFVGAQTYLGSGIFDRFLSIRHDIESGASSAIRLEIWAHAWQQFLRDPVFGNSLESQLFGTYPHNVLLEVLISTGLLGFVPFVLFVTYLIKDCWRILNDDRQFTWVITVFLLGLTENQFSGSIYSASWLAMGAAMVVGFRWHKNRTRGRPPFTCYRGRALGCEDDGSRR